MAEEVAIPADQPRIPNSRESIARIIHTAREEVELFAPDLSHEELAIVDIIRRQLGLAADLAMLLSEGTSIRAVPSLAAVSSIELHSPQVVPEADQAEKNEFSQSAHKTLGRLFGEAGIHIKYGEENIAAIIGAIKNPYLTNRTSRSGGQLQIHRLRLHLQGQTDKQIGAQENPPRTANGPREGRHSMLTRIEKFSTVKERLEWLRAVAERRALDILNDQYIEDHNESKELVNEKPPVNLHHDVEIVVGAQVKKFYMSVNRRAGEDLLDPELSSEDEVLALLDLYAQSNQSSRATIDDDIARQVEQLRLYFSGMGPTAIARELGLDSRKLVSGSMASVANIIGRALQALPPYTPESSSVTEIPVLEEIAEGLPSEEAGISIVDAVSVSEEEVEESEELSDLLRQIQERFGPETLESWNKLLGGSENKDELEKVRAMLRGLLDNYAPIWRPCLEGNDGTGLSHLHWRAIECIIGSQNPQGVKMQTLEGAGRQLRSKLMLRGLTIEDTLKYATNWLLTQTVPIEPVASVAARPSLLATLPPSGAFSPELHDDGLHRRGADVIRKLAREGLIKSAQETMLMEHFGYRSSQGNFKPEHKAKAIVVFSQLFNAAVEKTHSSLDQRPPASVVPIFDALLGDINSGRHPVSRKELKAALNHKLGTLSEAQLDDIIDSGFEWLQRHKVRR